MLAPNAILQERYQISYAVDEHPDCVIYRAIDRQDGRRVLLAELPQPDHESLEDTRRLARQVAAIQARGLLSLRDHFADGLIVYMVADDPGGEDLERSVHGRSGPHLEHAVFQQIEDLLTVFELLHTNQPQLLVSDLRPTDVWTASDNTLHLAPFVLARPFGAEPSPYRAPEMNDPQHKPTTSGDLYALGAILYKLLTGWAPPTAAQREAGIPLNPPRSLNPHISGLTEQMVLRSLDMKPANRYQSAREMRRALDIVRLMQGRSLGLETPHAPEEPRPAESLESPPLPEPGPPAEAPADSEQTGAPPPPVPPLAPVPPPGLGSPAYSTSQAFSSAPNSPVSVKQDNTCLFIIVGMLAVMALALCFTGFWMLVGPGRSVWENLAQVPNTIDSMPGNLSGIQVTPETGARPLAQEDGPGTSGDRLMPTPNPQAITSGTIRAITETRQITESLLGPILYSPDGTFLAVGLGETITLRDANTLDLIRTLEGHTGALSTLAFAPARSANDPLLLASGARDEATIRVWNIRTGRQVQQLKGHTGWIRSLAFSPGGTLIASGSTDNTIKLWDARSGKLVRTLTGHTDWLGNIAFSPDEKLLASAGRDGTLRVWRVADGKEREQLRFIAPTDPTTGEPSWLTGVAFSPDGKLIAAGSTDGTVRVFDATTGDLLQTLEGHTGWVVIRGVEFAPDGKILASASLDGTIRLWDPRTGAQRGVFERRGLRVLAISWHPDGDLLVSSSDEGAEVLVWNRQSGEVVRSLRSGQGLVTALTYSLDGQMLATGSINGTMRLHLLAENRQLTLTGGSPSSQSIAFVSDTDMVAISDTGNVVKFNPTQEQEGQVLRGLEGVAFSLAVSPDLSSIAAGSNTGAIVLWDAQNGQILHTFDDLKGSIFALTFSSDSRWIIAASTTEEDASEIGIWDATAGSLEHILTGHTDSVTRIAARPGSQVFASISRDGTLKLWDIEDGRETRTIRAPRDQAWFTSVTFSPDGKLLITGSVEGTVTFWDPDTGEEQHRVDFADHPVLATAFRRDGEQLAVSLGDGSIHLLEVKQ